MRPRRWVAALLAAAVLVIAGVATGWLVTRRPGAGEGSGAADGVAASAGAVEPALSPQGDSYRLSFTQELRSDKGPPRRVRIEGLWQSVPPATVADRAGEWAFRLTEVHALADTAGTADSEREFAEAAAHPFLVSYARNRPVRARFFPGVSPAVRNLLLAVLVELPCERPQSSAPVVTNERDLFGRYLAALQPDADRRGFERHKLKYLDLAVPEAQAPLKTALAISLSQSTWRCRLAADGKLERLDGTEHVSVDVGVAGLVPDVRTELHLAAQGTFDATPVRGALAGARAALVATSIVTQQVDPADSGRTADEDLVRGTTLPELLRRFQRLANESGASDLGQLHVAIEQLAAWVRLRPDSLTAIVAQIRSPPPSSRDGGNSRSGASESEALIQALGRANRPAARQSLIDLARDAALASDLRVAAVRSLAQGEPDSATLEALDRLIGDKDGGLREAAVYAYGTSLAAWRRIDPPAAASALAKLIARLEQAPESAQRALLLGGIGNAGDAAALPAIRRALANADAPTRGAAVQALRAVMAPGVDQLITEVIRHDASPSTRASAIFTAGLRDVTTYADALADAALTDPESLVRSSAVAMLGRILGTAPRARQALSTVAKDDANPQIRKHAQHLLAAVPAATATPAGASKPGR